MTYEIYVTDMLRVVASQFTKEPPQRYYDVLHPERAVQSEAEAEEKAEDIKDHVFDKLARM